MTIEQSYPDTLTNDLSHDVRETHINFTTQDRRANEATIYTDDPTIYAQLLRKGYEPTRLTDVGAVFEIEYRLVSILTNKPKRVATEAEKEAARERMAESHALGKL